MPVPETDYQRPNKNIYISEIWVLLKTNYRKLGYRLKLATIVYAMNYNVSWISKHKDKQKS